MTPEELAAIRARCEAATPPPWSYGNGKVELVLFHGADPGEGDFLYTDADGEFASHARQDVPALLAEVERLRPLAEDAATVYGQKLAKLIAERDGARGEVKSLRELQEDGADRFVAVVRQRDRAEAEVASLHTALRAAEAATKERCARVAESFGLRPCDDAPGEVRAIADAIRRLE